MNDQLFSSAGYIINKQWLSLSPETDCQCVSLLKRLTSFVLLQELLTDEQKTVSWLICKAWFFGQN